jgi:hypothetical protein
VRPPVWVDAGSTRIVYVPSAGSVRVSMNPPLVFADTEPRLVPSGL